MSKVIFPGSFDPITNGHIDLIVRASRLFKSVVVAVAKDTTGRQASLSYEQRFDLVKQCLNEIENVTVKPFEGLLIDFYQQEQADAVLRGLRNGKDFEYEMQLAQVNKAMQPKMESLFLPASASHLFLSATLVREILALGGDIRPFVPEKVAAFYASF